jgi:hypothetical protein
MDELQFKRHLKDLAHGHHHPEEHDWKNAMPVEGTQSTRKAARPKRASGKPAKKAR